MFVKALLKPLPERKNKNSAEGVIAPAGTKVWILDQWYAQDPTSIFSFTITLMHVYL